MISADEHRVIDGYSEQAQAFITRHIIPSSPMNYSVIYLYVTQ